MNKKYFKTEEIKKWIIQVIQVQQIWTLEFQQDQNSIKYAMETLNVGDFFTNGCQEGGKKFKRLPDQLHGLKILGRTLEINAANINL